MHVTATSRNAYEWSRAVGLGKPYGPSSMCMVTCIRAFCGLSVFFGIVRIRMSTLRVPYGARVGTVRALADALRACEHLYANRP